MFDYSFYPFQDYRTNHDLIYFPMDNDDTRLPRKERVHGIVIDGLAKAYRIDGFPDLNYTINDFFADRPLVITGNSEKNFVVSFERTLDDRTVLSFKAVQDELPVIMYDEKTGSKWDIFGVCVEGDYEGTKLTTVVAFNAYWFAWAAFYPDTELFPL